MTPTGQEISGTFAVRLHLEKMAAARAIKLATGSDIVDLKKYLAREDDIFKTRDIGLYYDLNHDLHLYIAEIAL